MILRQLLHEVGVGQDVGHGLGQNLAAGQLVGHLSALVQLQLQADQVVHVLSALGHGVEHGAAEFVVLYRVPLLDEMGEFVGKSAEHGVLGQVGNTLDARKTRVHVNVDGVLVPLELALRPLKASLCVGLGLVQHNVNTRCLGVGGQDAVGHALGVVEGCLQVGNGHALALDGALAASRLAALAALVGGVLFACLDRTLLRTDLMGKLALLLGQVCRDVALHGVGKRNAGCAHVVGQSERPVVGLNVLPLSVQSRHGLCLATVLLGRFGKGGAGVGSGGGLGGLGCLVFGLCGLFFRGGALLHGGGLRLLGGSLCGRGGRYGLQGLLGLPFLGGYVLGLGSCGLFGLRDALLVHLHETVQLHARKRFAAVGLGLQPLHVLVPGVQLQRLLQKRRLIRTVVLLGPNAVVGGARYGGRSLQHTGAQRAQQTGIGHFSPVDALKRLARGDSLEDGLQDRLHCLFKSLVRHVGTQLYGDSGKRAVNLGQDLACDLLENALAGSSQAADTTQHLLEYRLGDADQRGVVAGRDVVVAQTLHLGVGVAGCGQTHGGHTCGGSNTGDHGDKDGGQHVGCCVQRVVADLAYGRAKHLKTLARQFLTNLRRCVLRCGREHVVRTKGESTGVTDTGGELVETSLDAEQIFFEVASKGFVLLAGLSGKQRVGQAVQIRLRRLGSLRGVEIVVHLDLLLLHQVKAAGVKFRLSGQAALTQVAPFEV